MTSASAHNPWLNKLNLKEAVAHLEAVRLLPKHELDAKDREAIRIMTQALQPLRGPLSVKAT